MSKRYQLFLIVDYKEWKANTIIPTIYSASGFVSGSRLYILIMASVNGLGFFALCVTLVSHSIEIVHRNCKIGFGKGGCRNSNTHYEDWRVRRPEQRWWRQPCCQTVKVHLSTPLRGCWARVERLAVPLSNSVTASLWESAMCQQP